MLTQDEKRTIESYPNMRYLNIEYMRGMLKACCYLEQQYSLVVVSKRRKEYEDGLKICPLCAYSRSEWGVTSVKFITCLGCPWTLLGSSCDTNIPKTNIPAYKLRGLLYTNPERLCMAALKKRIRLFKKQKEAILYTIKLIEEEQNESIINS